MDLWLKAAPKVVPEGHIDVSLIRSNEVELAEHPAGSALEL